MSTQVSSPVIGKRSVPEGHSKESRARSGGNMTGLKPRKVGAEGARVGTGYLPGVGQRGGGDEGGVNPRL